MTSSSPKQFDNITVGEAVYIVSSNRGLRHTYNTYSEGEVIRVLKTQFIVKNLQNHTEMRFNKNGNLYAKSYSRWSVGPWVVLKTDETEKCAEYSRYAETCEQLIANVRHWADKVSKMKLHPPDETDDSLIKKLEQALQNLKDIKTLLSQD